LLSFFCGDGPLKVVPKKKKNKLSFGMAQNEKIHCKEEKEQRSPQRPSKNH
jgi:hypothetical protein